MKINNIKEARELKELAEFFENSLPPCWMAESLNDYGYLAVIVKGFIVVGFYCSDTFEEATAILVQHDGTLWEAKMVLASPPSLEQRCWVPLKNSLKRSRKEMLNKLTEIEEALKVFFSEILDTDLETWNSPLASTYWTQRKSVGIFEPEPAPEELEEIQISKKTISV